MYIVQGKGHSQQHSQRWNHFSRLFSVTLIEIALVVDYCIAENKLKLKWAHALAIEDLCCTKMFASIFLMQFSISFQWVEITLYSPINCSLPIRFDLFCAHRKFNNPHNLFAFEWNLCRSIDKNSCPNELTRASLQADGKTTNDI